MGIPARHLSLLALPLLMALAPLLSGCERVTSVSTDGRLCVPLPALAVSTAVAALTGFMLARLSRRTASKVLEMRQVAEEMAEGALDKRLPVGGSDDLAALAATINRLADQLKRTIEGITEEKNTLDAILSSMADGVITIARDGTVTFANATAGRFVADLTQARAATGEPLAPAGEAREADARPPQQARLIGRSLYRDLDVSELTAACFDTREAITREMKLGETYMSVFAIPLKSHADGGAGEVMLLLRDVTSLRQVETARSQFLGNVSHELKTPLTIIKGFVVTLQKSEGIPEEWKRYLDFIDRETDRLTRLVNDLLNLARLRSKRTQMNFTFCEPLELLKDTCRQLLSQADKADVTLTFDAPTELPVLLADADRFKEIVLNLVDNAFKYSPPKASVRLTAEATAEHLVVVVHDSGSGIPAEEVPFLFERFFRGSEKGGRKSGGSGIGLAIVKEIIDAHRGSIRVESDVGVGTRFIVELPLRRVGRRKTDAAADESRG